MSRISNTTENAINYENHIAVFLNAAQLPSKSRSLEQMVTSAANIGSSCSKKPCIYSSTYYDTNILRKYSPSGSKNYGMWLDTIKVKLQSPITPVCSTNYFAAKVLIIMKKSISGKSL